MYCMVEKNSTTLTADDDLFHIRMKQEPIRGKVDREKSLHCDCYTYNIEASWCYAAQH